MNFQYNFILTRKRINGLVNSDSNGYLKEKNVLDAFTLKAFYKFYDRSFTDKSSRIVDRGISNHIGGANSVTFIGLILKNYIKQHKKRLIRKVKRLEVASRILEEL
jgi:hypothetical protein